MASCRSRRTGNCSDYSQNRLLQEKILKLFRSLSRFQDRLAYASVVWVKLLPMAPA